MIDLVKMKGKPKMDYLELLDYIEDAINVYFAGECYAAPELIELLDKIDKFKHNLK
jgi:hypothetical protein